MKNVIALLVSLFSLTTLAGAQIPTEPTDISPLLIGEQVPNVVLHKVNGQEVTFKSVTDKNKTVLVVYRGGWCPYCNRHLSEMQAIENKILELGYQIVAVSPDSYKNLQKTEKKEELNYQLFSDSKGDLIKKMGIAFQAPKKYGKMLNKYSGGGNENLLPVPSVFILDKEGKIDFEYINPDYSKRLSGDLLLAVLQNLAE